MILPGLRGFLFDIPTTAIDFGLNNFSKSIKDQLL